MRVVPCRIGDLTPEMSFAIHESGDQHVSESLARNGVWEPFESELILRILRVGSRGRSQEDRRPLMLDCGANLGWYSVLAAVAGGVSVVAFEPMPSNALLLRQNVANNNVHDAVSVYEVALGDKTASGLLHLSETNQGDHRLHVGPSTDSSKAKETVLVPIRQIDDILSEGGLPRPRLVKIDTQGSEVNILRGGLSAWHPNDVDHDVALVVEFWPYGLLRCGSSADEFLDLLCPLINTTHRCFEVQEWSRSLVDLDETALRTLATSHGLSLEVRGFTNIALLPISLLHEDPDLLVGL
jgi:FkbM family methyltransferase